MNLSRSQRLPRRLPIVMAGALAIAGVLFASSQADPAHAVTAGNAAVVTAKTDGAKPTIVLAHGAWADSGSWNAVTRILQDDGYTVYAPPNPLQGLAYDTATLTGFLGTISGPVVLVGHSYAGEVITNAALGDSQVKALVYDDAYLPAQGESLESLTTAGSCFAVPDPTTVFNFATFPGAPSGVVDAYVKPSVFPGCFANGLPAAEGAVLAATQRPLATSTLTDQSGAPAWATIPSWAIVGLNDHVITPAQQLFMAHRAHAHVTEISAPHLSMISNPSTVARVIIQAAKATA